MFSRGMFSTRPLGPKGDGNGEEVPAGHHGRAETFRAGEFVGAELPSLIFHYQNHFISV